MVIITDIDVLDELGLKIGDEITLLDLDDRVEKYINDDEMETPLESFNYDEILRWKRYLFYTDDDSEYYYKINFEVVKNTDDENSIIRILE